MQEKQTDGDFSRIKAKRGKKQKKGFLKRLFTISIKLFYSVNLLQQNAVNIHVLLNHFFLK